MPVYKAPVDEVLFLLNDVFQISRYNNLPGFADASPDLIEPVLAEAAKLCEQVVQPLNLPGDREGCTRHEDGRVTTPKGFKEAYRQYAEGGWMGVSAPTEFGGQGLPETLTVIVNEMMASANMAFAMYPGLTQGAIAAILRHGTPEQKAAYLPKMIEGRWTGTMNLTEPHCGTDLGLLRTKAVKQGDGTYKITGTKIFISAGEHDLTDNILHLVLARLPDAPAGIRGISLFLVPKFLVGDDGAVGARNGVRCGSIEHKMGIKASATCVMNFDEAEGTLVGKPHSGMRAMFTMMNSARLGVALQGLGVGEVAYQSARAYASDRLQGRALSGTKAQDNPADPIIVHPDVRRMLLTMKAQNEAARALACWIGFNIDIAEKHPDAAERDAAEDPVALMTPVLKSHLTDAGFEAANLGVQVMGGHGYIREQGMEQLVRDARIAQIYEGANGIQALDLVGRKLPMHNGRLLRRFFHPVDNFIAEHKDVAEMQEFVLPLAKALGKLQQATVLIAQRGLRNPDEAGAAASDYLKLFALTASAFMWARMVKVSLPKLAGEETWFYKGKLATARFFMSRILPETSSLLTIISAGAKPLMELEAEAF